MMGYQSMDTAQFTAFYHFITIEIDTSEMGLLGLQQYHLLSLNIYHFKHVRDLALLISHK